MNISVCDKMSRQSLPCYSCNLFTRIIRNSCGRLRLRWGDLEGLYAPFGEVLHEYNAYWMLDTIPRLLFNGKELDEESGMYYYSARYFKPPTFISRDPLFEKKHWINPYHYCSNNPVKRIDPDGMHDYEVDRKTGDIILLRRTRTSQLVVRNEKREFEYNKDGTYKNSVTVKKPVIECAKQDKKGIQLNFGSGKAAEDKAIEVFDFLSDNTDVEWGVVGYGTGGDNMNIVATNRSSENEQIASEIALNESDGGNLNYYYHSHTGKNSSNFPSRGRPGEGGNDLNVWNNIWAKSPDAVMGIRYYNSTQRYQQNLKKRSDYSPIINR